MQKEIVKLKIDLLCKGLTIPETDKYADMAKKSYPTEGKSRAGIAGSGITLILEYGEPCNIGILQPFLNKSPYQFQIIENEGWILKNNEKIIKAEYKKPKWNDTELINQVQLHGKDSLATSLSNYCHYKQLQEGCKFCIIDIGGKIITRNPQEIAGAIQEIEKSSVLREYKGIGCSCQEKNVKKYIEPKDININAGALKGAGVELYVKAISAIKKVSSLPIGIQICPVEKEGIKELYYAGADEISFNLEVYDEKIRKEAIPGKSRDYPGGKYFRAMKEAIKIFGVNNVHSWIIIGLEPKEKTIEGMRKIAETGAIPLPKPFRPLYTAEYEKKQPPDTEDAIEIYQSWLDIIRACGLNPLKTKAGCGRCNGCFPIKELLLYGI